MTRIVVLDSGPLSLVTQRQGVKAADACRERVAEWVRAGWTVVVPAIADFEVRRELERAGKTTGLARLDAFNAARPGRYLPLSDEALRLAARLWARARRQGTPTADPKELDCDVLVAAQALTFGAPVDDLVVATTNIGHLSLFITAQTWENLHP